MPTETTMLPWCDCYAERVAGEETYRGAYIQCPCCGALMSFASEEFPRHAHVARFSDVVALR